MEPGAGIRWGRGLVYFVCSFIHSCMHSSILSFFQSIVRSFIHACIHPFFLSFVRSIRGGSYGGAAIAAPRPLTGGAGGGTKGPSTPERVPPPSGEHGLHPPALRIDLFRRRPDVHIRSRGPHLKSLQCSIPIQNRKCRYRGTH